MGSSACSIGYLLGAMALAAAPGCRNHAGPRTSAQAHPDRGVPSDAVTPATPPLERAPSPAGGASAAAEADMRPLGMGLGQVVEWTTQFPFLNLVKQARPWTYHEYGKPWGKGAPAERDARGWIRSLAPNTRAELIILIATDSVPFDRFLVTWKGQGTFRYRGNAKSVGAGPKGFRDTVQVSRQDGRYFFSIEISATDSKDPLRDFVVVPEVFVDNWHNKERFNPEWLKRLRPFRLLRFMDWMQTNNSRQRRWSDRPHPEDLSYRAAGVPLEVMIELGNELDADVWFNIPHLADEEYVRAFATMVKERLEPGRKAWFEHSNEVWNWTFMQAKHANATGRMLWRNKSVVSPALNELLLNKTQKLDLRVLERAKLPPDLAQVERDIAEFGLQRRLEQVISNGRKKQDALLYVLSRMLGAAPGNSFMQYNGMRAAQICDIVKGEVFAGMTKRVRCVIGAQTANHGLVEPALRCANWSQAPCVNHGIDALAIAGYVGHSLVTTRNAQMLRRWAEQGEAGARAVVAEISGARKLPDDAIGVKALARDFAFHAKVAKKHGLEMVAYEGGQHLVASGVPELRNDAKVLKLLRAANAHPDMGKLYRRLLDAWKAAGGGVFVHFVDVSRCSKSGCWGALERYEEDSAKYNALKAWSEENPRWWANAGE